MPFDPIDTDEHLEAKPPRVKSFEDKMLAGCSGFILVSLLTFGLGVWPFIAFHNELTWASLVRSFAVGLGPATLLGILASRRFGLPGAGGFLGGALSLAVFLNLDIKRVHLAIQARPGTEPDFPGSMSLLVPLGWVIVALVVALMALPKGEVPFSADEDDKTP